MAMKLGAVILDGNDPEGLASFYSKLTGWTVQRSTDPSSPYVDLANPDGGVELGIQHVPEPKRGKNRAHFDFHVDDIDLEAQRAVTLGATVVKRFTEGDEGWIWMTDPEGNEFCFCNSCG
jgi:predicted enzyme related to lactoylglutathione lyase